MVEKVVMDRRKFLLGSVSAAALGASVKPAPAPVWEISKMPLAEWSLTLDPNLSASEVMQAYRMYYGNDEVTPMQFTGFVPGYAHA